MMITRLWETWIRRLANCLFDSCSIFLKLAAKLRLSLRHDSCPFNSKVSQCFTFGISCPDATVKAVCAIVFREPIGTPLSIRRRISLSGCSPMP